MKSIQIRKWAIIFASCLLALLYPCAELHCWDTAGKRTGTWTEISCDGYEYTGSWSGYVTNDCRFVGANQWESVSGKISPDTRVFKAAGICPNGCGSIDITGTFTHDFLSVSGSYIYSKSGGGTFSGDVPIAP